MEPEERAQAGVFLAFQYPVEIPGVTNAYFLRSRLQRAAKGEGRRGARLDGLPRPSREKLKIVDWGPEIMSRAVNDGFSGGEKKRNEILQMAVLEPRLAILDETDSGLDIDALRDRGRAASTRCARPDNATFSSPTTSGCSTTSCPTTSTSSSAGRIVKSGGKELALELEAARLRVAGGDGGSRLMTAGAGAGFRGARRHRHRGGVPDWLEPIAAERPWSGSRSAGFPAPRDEEWRFTPLERDRPGQLATCAQRLADGASAGRQSRRSSSATRSGPRSCSSTACSMSRSATSALCLAASGSGSLAEALRERRRPARAASHPSRSDRGQRLHGAQYRLSPRGWR